MLTLTLSAYALSPSCLDVINLAIGMRLDVNQPSIYDDLLIDCCGSTTGVTCIGNLVTEIYWNGWNLDGTINGTAFPSTLTFVDFGSNSLTGNVPEHYPIGIITLNLNYNLLTGSIKSLPPNLITLSLDQNYLTGDVPPLPSSLQYMWLGSPSRIGNHFTGVVALNRPSYVFINNNWITDIIIQDTTQMGNNCDLSYNPLQGNPRLAGLPGCRKTNLYSIPNTISTSKNTYKSSIYTVSLFSSGVSISSTLTRSILNNIESVQGFYTYNLKSSIFSALSNTNLNYSVVDHTSIYGVATLLPIFFHPIVSPLTLLAIALMVIRLIINAIILGVVLSKTPFARHFRQKNSGKSRISVGTGFEI